MNENGFSMIEFIKRHPLEMRKLNVRVVLLITKCYVAIEIVLWNYWLRFRSPLRFSSLSPPRGFENYFKEHLWRKYYKCWHTCSDSSHQNFYIYVFIGLMKQIPVRCPIFLGHLLFFSAMSPFMNPLPKYIDFHPSSYFQPLIYQRSLALFFAHFIFFKRKSHVFVAPQLFYSRWESF